MMQIDNKDDTIIYSHGGKVVDIDIYSNLPIEEMEKKSNEFTKEIIDVYREQNRYYNELASELEKIIPVKRLDEGEKQKNKKAGGEPKGGEPKDGEPKDKNNKEGKLKRLEDLLANAKESGDEDKIKKVQDLIDKISAKESWQIEGTKLGILLEMEISKLESNEILNESKYQINSIKDAFRKLM